MDKLEPCLLLPNFQQSSNFYSIGYRSLDVTKLPRLSQHMTKVRSLLKQKEAVIQSNRLTTTTDSSHRLQTSATITMTWN